MSTGIGEAFGWALEPTPWSAQAACARSDPDLFFPVQGGSARGAKAVCAGCPVRFECLEYALRWNIVFGIWGGLSHRQRRKLTARTRPQRVPPPHGTGARYHVGCRCSACRLAHQQDQAEYKRRQADLWDEEPIDGRPVQTIQVRRAL